MSENSLQQSFDNSGVNFETFSNYLVYSISSYMYTYGRIDNYVSIKISWRKFVGTYRLHSVNFDGY